MRRAAAIVAVTAAAALSGCASPSHHFRQLPIELRVIHVESSSANLPRELFTGPLPLSASSKAMIPGDPWSEAAKIIAQAVSDSFKWGFQSASFQSEHATQHKFISVDILSMRWGEPKEPMQSAQMWAEYRAFLGKLPQPIPMYKPNVEDFAKSMQALQGWSDMPTKEGASR